MDRETQIENDLKEKFEEVDMPVSFCTGTGRELSSYMLIQWAGSSDQSHLLQDIGG